MNKFKCHKVVEAAIVQNIVTDVTPGSPEVFLQLEGGEVYETDQNWVINKNVEVGGYLVRYEDGYTSFSPREPFLAGYTQVATWPTLGQKRVRTTFNPSNLDYVYKLKEKSAELIDLINGAAAKPEWDDETFGEWKRLKAIAMSAIEDGGMYAVKMATVG